MNYSDAVKKARKYGLPAKNQFVRMDVEVALAYLDINHLEVIGWRDGFLVVRPKPLPSPPQTKSIFGEGVINAEKEEANETYPF